MWSRPGRVKLAGSVRHRYTTVSTPDPEITPSIVSTGLVLHLDAGNPASYPGSGTTWTNLASAGLNGTLGAGVTYSATGGGSLAFNGIVNGVVTITTASAVTSITNNITTEVWYKGDDVRPKLISTGVGSNGFCFGYFSNTGTAWKVSKYGKVDLQAGTIPQDTNVWHQAVLVYSSTEGTSVYIDGAFSGSTSPVNTATIAASAPATMYIGRLETTYHDGNISVVRVYNKVLSASEIQQNFNANRARYGI